MSNYFGLIAFLTGALSILLCIDTKPVSDRQRRNDLRSAKVLAVICGTAAGIAISLAVLAEAQA